MINLHSSHVVTKLFWPHQRTSIGPCFPQHIYKRSVFVFFVFFLLFAKSNLTYSSLFFFTLFSLFIVEYFKILGSSEGLFLFKKNQNLKLLKQDYEKMIIYDPINTLMIIFHAN